MSPFSMALSIFLFTKVVEFSPCFCFSFTRYEHLASLLTQMLQRKDDNAVGKILKRPKFFHLNSCMKVTISCPVHDKSKYFLAFSDVLENLSREEKRARFQQSEDALQVMTIAKLSRNDNV